MFPQNARRALALATVAAGAFGLAGCSIPNLVPNGVPTPTPPVAQEPTGTPSADPTASPIPTRTRPASSTRPTASTPPSSTRPSSSTTPYSPTPNDEQLENGYVPRSSLEIKIQDTIKQKLGAKSAYVSCPGNLLAKPGQTMTCTIKNIDSQQMNRSVIITVTSVVGNQVAYSIRTA